MFTVTYHATAAGVISGLCAAAILVAVVFVLLARALRKPAAGGDSDVYEPPYTEVPVPPIVFLGIKTDGEAFAVPPVEKTAARAGLSNCHIEDCEPCGRVLPEPFRYIELPAMPTAKLLKAAGGEEAAPGDAVEVEAEVIVGEPVLDAEPSTEQVIETLNKFRNSSFIFIPSAPEAGADAPLRDGSSGNGYLTPTAPADGLDVETASALLAGALGGAAEAERLADGVYKHTVKAVDRQVASVEIVTKSHLSVRAGETSGESVRAVALNAAGEVVSGARVKYRSTNPERVFVNQKTGAVTGQGFASGYASVFAVCQGVESARVRVRVR